MQGIIDTAIKRVYRHTAPRLCKSLGNSLLKIEVIISSGTSQIPVWPICPSSSHWILRPSGISSVLYEGKDLKSECRSYCCSFAASDVTWCSLHPRTLQLLRSHTLSTFSQSPPLLSVFRATLRLSQSQLHVWQVFQPPSVTSQQCPFSSQPLRHHRSNVPILLAS